MDEVIIARHDGWAEVALNRPSRRNAIDGPLAVALSDAIRTLNNDAAVNAVVLKGNGGSFCSGLDLKAFNATPPPEWVAGFTALWDDVHAALIESPKVVIVALERHAINGGAALALAGDLLVAGASAFLQVGEIQLGMAAPKNVGWAVRRHGEAIAARLCLLGDRVPAPELLRLGIATEVVDDEAVVARAAELAAKVATFPGAGVGWIKRALRAASASSDF